MTDIVGRLLNKWLGERRKHKGRNDMVDKRISESIGRIVDELMQRLRNHEDAVAKDYCAQDLSGEIKIEQYHKPLCKALMRTFMYMNGLKVREGRKIEIEEDTEEESFLKCIVGTTVMLKMLKKYCWFEDYMQYALRITEARKEATGSESNYNKCSGMNFNQLKIGNILVGNTVAKLVEGKESGIADYQNLERFRDGWCRHGRQSKVERKDGKKQEDEGKKWLDEEKMKELEKIVEDKGQKEEGKLGKVLEEMEKKRKIMRASDPCYKDQSGGFEEGEEDSIMEWFTNFFNNPSDADNDKYEWSKYDAYKSVCEDEDEWNKRGINPKKYGEFCRIMLKNLMMVENGANQYKPPGISDPQCKKKYIPLCDLLKIWMMDMGAFCVPKEVMHYVFDAVSAFSGQWGNPKDYVKCDYGKVSNLYRGNEDMLPKVQELLRNSMVGSKLGELNKKKWCDASKVQHRTPNAKAGMETRADKAAQGESVPDNGALQELTQLVQKVEAKVEEEENELSGIAGEAIKEVLSPQGK
ncbi:hypothetical protein PCOAH_00016000 [Plasmodium coatneyi]|uniref:Schizont-infected cell agglutination extracellular alpha domain-containing protein n=1 Tax=Plasmodium coatneyi TaxID=208452 RepID=A0A1B1DXA9_9APIC|nr:hypothetical protein PCOAH_00016000 [Plasmodium coatneyi]ANQ07398.1 hypothetical protein PCOAH_00016000 [Plasmodium coatneyi]